MEQNVWKIAVAFGLKQGTQRRGFQGKMIGMVRKWVMSEATKMT